MSDVCTTEDCHRLTTLYLCTRCIVELDGLLEDVPVLISFLDGPIERTSVTHNPGSGGGGHPGSKPPINFDAFLLKAWLCQLPARAHTAAMENPNAGQQLYMARIWVKQARELVWGAEEERIDHEANRKRIEDAQVDPLPPREAMDYVREKTKITIKVADFKNWVKFGHLKYVLDRIPTDDNARRIYYPIEVFRVAQKMRERRIKI